MQSFNCQIRFEAHFRNAAGTGFAATICVGIALFQGESRRTWIQLDTPDTRMGMPARGIWKWRGGDFGNLILCDETGAAFALLNPFTMIPSPRDKGAVFVLNAGQPAVLDGAAKFRATGKWEMLDKQMNLPEYGTTFSYFCQQLASVGELTGWELSGQAGGSITVGGKGYMGEILGGTLTIKNVRTGEERELRYAGAGIGYLLTKDPGGGGSYAPSWME
jgi:hypothetical protein